MDRALFGSDAADFVRWISYVPEIRQQFDAAAPAALSSVAEEYRDAVRDRVRAELFDTGAAAESIVRSPVSGTAAFRVRVFSKNLEMRLWELGFVHWRSGERLRHPTWRPVLYEKANALRELFRNRITQMLVD